MVLQTISRGVASRKNKIEQETQNLGENLEYQNLIIELPEYSKW